MRYTVRWTSARTGLTLLESLAAVVLLGTVLVGLMMARSRHDHQIAATQRQNAAIAVADELIAGWWARGDVPLNESGPTPADPTLAWATSVAPNAQVERIGGRVVRVGILEARDGQADAGRDPLIVVELVLPLPRPTPTSPAAGAQDIAGAASAADAGATP
jgi:hypothetical protein